MKSKLLFAFAVVAAFAAVLLSGCGKTESNSGCITFTGRDTGSHIVYIDQLNPGLTPISDTLDASVSGSSVTIHTMALQRNLTGSVDASDCNKINLDSVIFATTDTLILHSTTLNQPSGIIKIWGIRAGGSGTVTSTGANTVISIAKGNTNITALGGVLLDLNGKKLNLRGTFLKIN